MKNIKKITAFCLITMFSVLLFTGCANKYSDDIHRYANAMISELEDYRNFKIDREELDEHIDKIYDRLVLETGGGTSEEIARVSLVNVIVKMQIEFADDILYHSFDDAKAKSFIKELKKYTK